jgi:maltose alpha-D-glucosyltransferase / alpha-amylase
VSRGNGYWIRAALPAPRRSPVSTRTRTPHRSESDAEAGIREDPLWYKDAVVYQLHVRSFRDSSGDGVGDFRGLVEKLDYLHDLGVTALWLQPFYPSPLKDDGYDIAAWDAVNPAYGSMQDFQLFLREAHRRNLRVITELVLNHTSDQHRWFQRAREAPRGSRRRNFYVWSDTPERYREARIIFQDFETSNWAWDPVAQQYYWHRFYSHQPDLNYESADVQQAMRRVVDFWFGLGVDGLRLDAVPYLYEREGTSCENLPETHAFLRELRAHIDERFDNRMLLAEANQWPEDAAAYFGDDDECHMAFHFPVMPRLFMALRMEDRFPIIDILDQTPELGEGSQWAVFLRNHDELTLEMVTDEERDYMVRVYADEPAARINLGIRRRLAPLLGNDRPRIELMNGLLLSLPGTPIVYYGDEIGMGDNIFLGDRNGVRTPMQWTADRNAGFSRANPQRLFLPAIIDPEFHYETVNVEAQLGNGQSLLWWMRRLIALRKRLRVMGRGSLTFLSPENHHVLAFLRCLEDEVVLVVANLSRFPQFAELDLSAYEGMIPLELFGQTPFPPVGSQPYLLTLGPHAFYWFALQRPAAEVPDRREPDAPPVLRVAGDWERVLAPRRRAQLEAVLLSFIRRRRWFAGKDRATRSLRVAEIVRLPSADHSFAALVVVEIDYREGEPERYVLPLALLEGERADAMLVRRPQAIVAHVTRGTEHAVVVDGLAEPEFCRRLLEVVARRRRLREGRAHVAGRPSRALRALLGEEEAPLEPTLPDVEQTNSSVVFGNRLILKFFRRLQEGVNPDLEIGAALARSGFENAAPVLGSLDLTSPCVPGGGTLAVLHEIVPNDRDAWAYTLDELGRFYEQALTHPDGEGAGEAAPATAAPLLALADGDLPSVAYERAGEVLRAAELIGRRTAELHVALAAVAEPAFTPQVFTLSYQRSMYQSMRNRARRSLRALARTVSRLPEEDRALAADVLASEPEILERFRALLGHTLTGLRTRVHGDYHLGQVLHTGRDFTIIDFEGEPSAPVSQRRLRRSPLRDVASMLRSFDYAAHAAARDEVERGVVDRGSEGARLLEEWGRRWTSWASASFLRGYLGAEGIEELLPADRGELELLLDAFALDKALYEVGYEIGARPEWLHIPLTGILSHVGGGGRGGQ